MVVVVGLGCVVGRIDGWMDRWMDGLTPYASTPTHTHTHTLHTHTHEQLMLEGSKEYCMRAKIDMTSANGTMRDPVMYRANPLPHHRCVRIYIALSFLRIPPSHMGLSASC